jgi:WD40 repeat protein
VWDLSTGRAIRTLTSQLTATTVATAVVDGKPVAVSDGDNGGIQVWDLATGRATYLRLTGLFHQVSAVATAVVDGRPVAVAGVYHPDTRNGTLINAAVQVWDLTTGRAIHTLTGHNRSVSAVATVVMDGRPIAIASGEDPTVRVWDLATGRVIHTLTGHTREANAVAAAVVDGRPVAVTGDDDTVRVWDLSSGSCLTTFTLPHAAGRVTIAEDGTVVVGMGNEVIALTLQPVFRRLR